MKNVSFWFKCHLNCVVFDDDIGMTSDMHLTYGMSDSARPMGIVDTTADIQYEQSVEKKFFCFCSFWRNL